MTECNWDYQGSVRMMGAIIRKFGSVIPIDQHQDIMQSALLHCLKKHRDDQGQKFTTSLYRFTVWTCNNFIRQRRRSRLSHFPLPPSSIDHDEEDINHIRECLNVIGEEDREMIQDYFFREKTFQEIGLARGYSRQTATKKIRRAIDRLRDIFFGV